MSNALPDLKIRVQPAPETNDHEVRLLADDLDLIELFEPHFLGLDPNDLLVEPCPLLATPEPHPATIGRCGCGEVGCGSIELNIQLVADRVHWTTTNPEQIIQFNARQYSSEIERALGDYSWETPERTAARLIARAIDRQCLATHGLSFSWASARCPAGMMTVSLNLTPGPYQVLVRLPWNEEDIDKIVDQCKTLLRKPPESWPSVAWNPQGPNLGRPSIAGPGWS